MTPSQKARLIGIAIGTAILVGLFVIFIYLPAMGPACKECPPGVNVCRMSTETDVKVVLNQQPVFTLFIIPHPGDPAMENAVTDITTYTPGNDEWDRMSSGTFNLFNSSFMGAGNLIIANPLGGGSGSTITLDQKVNLSKNAVLMIVLGNSTRGIPIYSYRECETI